MFFLTGFAAHSSLELRMNLSSARYLNPGRGVLEIEVENRRTNLNIAAVSRIFAQTGDW